jgi:putative tricarboxylic transport membrane protein
VLGPLLEEHLRRAMIISHGDWTVFVRRPLSATLLTIAALVLAVTFLPAVSRKREQVFVEEE